MLSQRSKMLAVCPRRIFTTPTAQTRQEDYIKMVNNEVWTAQEECVGAVYLPSKTLPLL